MGGARYSHRVAQVSEPDSRPLALVVDDEPALNSLLVSLLEDEGYHVLSARDGHEAVALAMREPPDVALLDLMLPGLDGVAVARTLKAHPRTAQVPLLALTCTPHSIGPADTSLFVARMAKPFDVETLLLAIDGIVPRDRAA